MPVTDVQSNMDELTLTITARFAAPVERIWEVYADPRQLERIWGPPSHPATFVDHELTPGGRATYFMTGPDGEKYAGWWQVTEVEPPHRLAFDDGFADADFNPVPDLPVGHNVYTFTAVDGGTEAVYVSRYESAEALQKVLDMGVIEGASSAIDQIDGLVSQPA